MAMLAMGGCEEKPLLIVQYEVVSTECTQCRASLIGVSTSAVCRALFRSCGMGPQRNVPTSLWGSRHCKNNSKNAW